ncbi:Zn-ribbon domain-containing OB-fold protein [Neobacillus vireti]|uniref:Zn-ribbon domain-containing OB-fold protein n=1 Tax=Neobacillus vireti TaxID=220686 RepID=UPI00300027BB
MGYQKPIPLKTLDNHPYWDAADRHELMVQKCVSCNHYNHPPGPSCAKCGSPEVAWENLGDDIKGTVYSYIVSYRPFLPGFQDDLPLIIAQVELEKYPQIKIMANILGCNIEDVQIGMPVQMTWVDINEERAIPQWKPAER